VSAPGIVAFLRARLDEDEAAARLAGATPDERWRRHENAVLEDVPDGHRGAWIAQACEDEETAAHIASHDPARVLADVSAVRALIAVVASWRHRADLDAWVFCARAPETRATFPDDWDEGGDRCTCGRDRDVLAVLGPFAAVHAAHPDYQQAWKP
jgi:hypothetical protein